MWMGCVWHKRLRERSLGHRTASLHCLFDHMSLFPCICPRLVVCSCHRHSVSYQVLLLCMMLCMGPDSTIAMCKDTTHYYNHVIRQTFDQTSSYDFRKAAADSLSHNMNHCYKEAVAALRKSYELVWSKVCRENPQAMDRSCPCMQSVKPLLSAAPFAAGMW